MIKVWVRTSVRISVTVGLGLVSDYVTFTITYGQWSLVLE